MLFVIRRGRLRIPIYAIALGTPAGEVELRDSFGFLQRVQVPPDTETLKEIARLSGGRQYEADEADKPAYGNRGRGQHRPSQQDQQLGPLHVDSQPRRAFQGWRYLDPKDAPADLTSAQGGADLPDHLRRQLVELGAW